MWFAVLKTTTYTRKDINDIIDDHDRADQRLSTSYKNPKDTGDGQKIYMIAPLIKRKDDNGKLVDFEYFFIPHRQHGGSGGDGIDPNRLVRTMERQMRVFVNKEYNKYLGKNWVHYNNDAFDLWNKNHHDIYMKQLGLAVNPMNKKTHISWLSKTDKKESADMDDLYQQYRADKIAMSAGINKVHNAFPAFKDAMAALCSVGGEE